MQRSKVAYYLLSTTAYGLRDDGAIGIDTLLDAGAFTAGYPLHDVSACYVYFYPLNEVVRKYLDMDQCYSKFYSHKSKSG